jgi:serine/threonine kinase 16
VVSCTEPSDLELVRKEAALYGRFNHKHIIKLVSSEARPSATNPGATDLLMVFPAYPRGTIQARVDKIAAANDRMPQRTVLELFHGVCVAVAVLHRLEPEGIAHRDLKLANVLLDETDTPILMDFGSCDTAAIEIKSYKDAMFYQEKAAQHSSMPYRAPELFDMTSASPPLTDKTDIWSLGCMLYTMCYHATPFESVAGATGSLPLAIAQGKIVFPPQQGLDGDPYTEDVRVLIQDLLQLTPSTRPEIETVIARVSALL